MSRIKSSLVFGLATLAAAAVVAGLGQSPVQAQAQAETKPSKVGLIDMAEVFKDYWKFANLREDLKAEMVRMDASAKPKMQEMQRLRQQLGELAQGSPERSAVEEQLITISTELEALRKKAQVDVMRKESEIYKDVYLEIQQAVGRFAAYYKYDVIIRFNSTRLEEAANPQAILQQMNRQVVYHNPQDDITNTIVKYLNSEYKKAGGTEPAAAQK